MFITEQLAEISAVAAAATTAAAVNKAGWKKKTAVLFPQTNIHIPINKLTKKSLQKQK